MNCSEFQQWIEASFGGDIEAELPQELESHIISCPTCVNELATWQMCFDWLLKSFPQKAPPEDLWNRICTSMEGEQGRG